MNGGAADLLPAARAGIRANAEDVDNLRHGVYRKIDDVSKRVDSLEVKLTNELRDGLTRIEARFERRGGFGMAALIAAVSTTVGVVMTGGFALVLHFAG